MRLWLMLCSLLLFTGCAVGPDHVRPYTLSPERFKEAVNAASPQENVWRPAAPGTVDASPWWTVFNDSALNAMMPQLEAANQDIRAAEANLRLARAQVREARAAFFPSIGADAAVRRGVVNPGQRTGTSHSAQLQASWELDIWGGTRRDVESREAGAEASAADLANILLSMRAELAQNYFQLRSLDEQMILYRQTVEAFTRSYDITRNQYNAGVVTRLDVAQAEAQLKAAEAQAIDLDLQRRKTEHAIATLLGMPPALLTLKPGTLPEFVPQADAELPSTLLERRPDVAAAGQRVAEANAKIGVAQSAYFPTLNLAASGGYVSSAIEKWFTSPYQIWSFGPALALSLFEGGARLARSDQAVAAWEAAVAAYRQAVLGAFQEVEDQLAAASLLQSQEAKQQEATLAARRAEELALSQYTAGTVTYLSVVSAQTTALANARTSVGLRGQRFLASVALIRALGGGWHSDGVQ